MRRPRLVRNGWFAGRYLLGSHGHTYPLLRFAPAPYARVMVTRGTEACIEGLPRAANTFGAMAFMDQNPRVRLAHHMHVPYQFLKAVSVGVPCAVLIREPLGNLTSLVIAGENDLSHQLAFRVYLDYHRRLLGASDQVTLCTFDQVLSDPSVVARRLNDRFATQFVADPMDEGRKQAIVRRLEDLQRRTGTRPGHGTVPNAYKEGLKPKVRAQLSSNLLLPTAQALYDELAARAIED